MGTENKDECRGGVLHELVEIAVRMEADKARLEETCSVIAAGKRAGKEEADPPVARRGTRGRRKGSPSGSGPTRGGEAERVRKEPWRKVLCARCGTKTGAIRKGPGAGVLFPSRHKDGAGNRCPGVEQVAKLVTEE